MRVSLSKRGFTLVEFLVLITIIGILISLLLPALQAAREAARLGQCNDHLTQIGKAALNCESALKHFPAGGWAAYWVGNPDRGCGQKQPGGPLFNILPYMEQTAVYSLQANKTVLADLQAAAVATISTPLVGFYCPSRRQAKAYPQLTAESTGAVVRTTRFVSRTGATDGEETGGIAVCGRSDYVGNGYHYYGLIHSPVNVASIQGFGAGVGTGGTGTYGMDLLMADKTAFDQFMNGRDPKDKPYRGGQNVSIAGQGGLFYPLSTVEVSQIQDGTANTFLFGEKYANPDWVETGFRHGDCWDMYGGAGPDVLGYCANYGFSKDAFGLIKKDTSGCSPEGIFGSPHPGGANFVMADGSVRQISYAIDSEVLNNLGNRNDGNAIDVTDLAR